MRIVRPMSHLVAREGAADHGNIDPVGASGQQQRGASPGTGLRGHDVIDQEQVRTARYRRWPWLVEGAAQFLSSATSTSGMSPVPNRSAAQGLFDNAPRQAKFIAENFGEKASCVEPSPGSGETSARDGDHAVDRAKFGRNLPGESSRQGFTGGSVTADFPAKNSGLAGCLGTIEAECFGTTKRRGLGLAGRAAGARTRMGTMRAGVLAGSQSISAGGTQRRRPRHVKRASAEHA